MKSIKKNRVQELALERIYRLFELAEAEFSKHPERSKRYVEMARKLSKRNKATIPTELKNKFCKKCGAYLKEGKSSKHSTNGSFLLIECHGCEHVRKTKGK
tara:strand:+ start:599 stop:901 length:303 start_codon:yes stop_codon:yes gene_type:complete